MNSPSYSPFTALSLKIVGIILIISALLNFIITAIPLNMGDRQWQVQYISQVVNQGFIPLLGIVLLIVGYWVDQVGGRPSQQRSSFDLKFPAFLLASLLGLIFLLFIPLHLNNVSQESSEQFAQIRAREAQFEAQIQNETQQLRALVQNDQQFQELEQAIESGQVQGEQLQQLQTIRDQVQQLRNNPNALEEQVQAARNELEARRREAEQQERTRALRSMLSVGLSSLLLAVGYIAIGWIGFRSLVNPSGKPSSF